MWISASRLAISAVRGRAFVPTDLDGLGLWLDYRTGVYQNSDGTTAASNSDPVGYWGDKSALDTTAKAATAPAGSCFINDTTSYTGQDIYQVVVLEDAQFTTLTADDVDGVQGSTVPAPGVISSDAGITAIELASGSVMVYRNS